MAADDKWYFTKEQLQNTPSRKCGLDADKELSYRQQAANFIQDMGQKLQVYPSHFIHFIGSMRIMSSHAIFNICMYEGMLYTFSHHLLPIFHHNIQKGQNPLFIQCAMLLYYRLRSPNASFLIYTEFSYF